MTGSKGFFLDRIDRINRIKNCFFSASDAVNVAVNETACHLE